MKFERLKYPNDQTLLAMFLLFVIEIELMILLIDFLNFDLPININAIQYGGISMTFFNFNLVLEWKMQC